MAQHDVHALPVWAMDYQHKPEGQRVYLRIVNDFDLMTYTAFQVKRGKVAVPCCRARKTDTSLLLANLKPVFDADKKMDLLEGKEPLVEVRAEFLTHPIREVLGMTKETSKLHTVRMGDPLAKLITMMAHGVHRVLVAAPDEAHDPRLISQIDLLRFLFNRNESFQDLLNISAQDVMNRALKQRVPENAPAGARTLTITIHNTAIVGFKKMRAHNVTSVGIVDHEDHLISSLSAANLRGLNKERLAEVVKPVLVFLRNSMGEVPPPHICTPKFTLAQVIAHLLRERLHRVFVVDEDQVPLGVISLSDVISMFEASTEDIVPLQTEP
ncbi:hypothetical protein HK104_009285 [Borealophlyctis nickersoniae]|nr:hypothetical protein HK104_009285 [Borealophlyctis nickersoniae]